MIGLTYNVCMFMMNDKGRSNLPEVPLMNNGASSQ